MTLADVKPGQKVNIQILQEASRAAISGETVTQYVSRVFDKETNGTLVLEMPTKEGKLLLLPVNIRYEFIFFIEGGMYKAEGTITDRFKRGNFFLFHAKISSEFVKFQRRQYYRLNCTIPVAIQALKDNVEDLDFMTEVEGYMRTEEGELLPNGSGTAVDISGGGIRIVSPTYIPDTNYFLLQFYLDIQGKRSMIELIGKLIALQRMEDSIKYTYRFKFLFKDSKLQESIIHYIFEEERRIRKKEQG